MPLQRQRPHLAADLPHGPAQPAGLRRGGLKRTYDGNCIITVLTRFDK